LTLSASHPRRECPMAKKKKDKKGKKGKKKKK